MIVDLGQCDRRMDTLNVVDMPKGNPVGYAGKPVPVGNSILLATDIESSDAPPYARGL
jgi:hypothetical protein